MFNKNDVIVIVICNDFYAVHISVLKFNKIAVEYRTSKCVLFAVIALHLNFYSVDFK